MDRLARRRRELRPHGSVAASCHDCWLFDRCGGIVTEPSLFDNSCFAQFCCQRADCDLVCPYNRHFQRDMRELHGLRFENLPQVVQRAVELPWYIPLIHHRYCHHQLLYWPVVALKTSDVVRRKRGRYRTVAQDAEGLRRAFRLAPATRVILRGTDVDPHLERYWELRRLEGVPERLARLGIDLAIGPNFSHFLGVVRTETLGNRMRQLLCLGEMQQAGLSPVPHLSAVEPADWRFWEWYLRDRPGIRVVAVEFETGNKNPTEGRKVIDRIASIQEAVGRRLHLLAIGGTQFTEYLAGRLEAFTLLDSTPFMKAVKRQVFDPNKPIRPWKKVRTERGQAIDPLIVHNLTHYAGWVQRRCQAVGDGKPKATDGFRPEPARRLPLPVCNNLGE
jgi:hypothetical protein